MTQKNNMHTLTNHNKGDHAMIGRSMLTFALLVFHCMAAARR
jgi:hypothetical protein